MVKFQFIRDRDNFPIGCLAYTITKSKDECFLHFGLSVQNPVDKWNRAMGRKIAEARLKKAPERFDFDVEEAKTSDILHDLFLALKKDHSLPHRVRRALNLKPKSDNVWVVENTTATKLFGAFTSESKAKRFAKLHKNKFNEDVVVSGAISLNPVK